MKKKIRIALFSLSAATVVFISIVIILAVINRTIHRRIPVDATEEYIDEHIGSLVLGDNRLDKKPLIGTLEAATSYAMLLYETNLGEWDDRLELWIKRYPKYGVWYAALRADGWLEGPPSIVFREEDGQVIWYAR
jgi:hypothetical protein